MMKPLKQLLRRVRFSLVLVTHRGQTRHIVRWNRSLRDGFLLSAPSPWMTFDAIDALRGHLTPGMKVFEYGSGGSSLFWLASGAHLVSVEHDQEWYEILAGHLRAISGVDYRLILPEPLSGEVPEADPADPHAYRSTDERVLNASFRAYASAIDEFPEESFDIISIDGRARPSCILHAVRRVKKGGLLVLDNAERGYYLEQTGELLAGFEKREFPGCGPCNFHLWQTNIYRRTR